MLKEVTVAGRNYASSSARDPFTRKTSNIVFCYSVTSWLGRGLDEKNGSGRRNTEETELGIRRKGEDRPLRTIDSAEKRTRGWTR